MSLLATYKRELFVAAAYGAMLLALALAAPSFYRAQFFATWVNSAPLMNMSLTWPANPPQLKHQPLPTP